MSRLQGKARNRRDPAGTFFGRVVVGKGEPKPATIKASRESDLLIVVLKRVEYGYPCECVERRGRPVKDHEGEKGEPYTEMESRLSATPACAGSGMSQKGWLTFTPGYLAGRAGCGNAARPVL